MEKQYVKDLIKTMASIKDAGTFESFLHSILTPAEFEEIPKRLQIVKLLMKGVPQREVAQKLGVGIATVTRGSRELKYGNNVFQKVL